MPENVVQTVTTLGSDEEGATTTARQFMPCKCVGVPPGRACPACSSTRWLKRCSGGCNGSGLLFRNRLGGASKEPRGERCSFCVGRGYTSAMPKDMPAIQRELQLIAEAADLIPSEA